MTTVDTFTRLCQPSRVSIGRRLLESTLIGRADGGDLIGRLHYWCRHLAYLQLLVQLSLVNLTHVLQVWRLQLAVRLAKFQN